MRTSPRPPPSPPRPPRRWATARRRRLPRTKRGRRGRRPSCIAPWLERSCSRGPSSRTSPLSSPPPPPRRRPFVASLPRSPRPTAAARTGASRVGVWRDRSSRWWRCSAPPRSRWARCRGSSRRCRRCSASSSTTPATRPPCRARRSCRSCCRATARRGRHHSCRSRRQWTLGWGVLPTSASRRAHSPMGLRSRPMGLPRLRRGRSQARAAGRTRRGGGRRSWRTQPRSTLLRCNSTRGPPACECLPAEHCFVGYHTVNLEVTSRKM
mmetsp:Transcript_33252/g.106756  ORF Transcript_33252/g.106756 Transcript_33252/m.106756 type:complete len:267 (+) Transcript_33252:2098-2898(+)